MHRLPYLLPFHFEESKRKLDGGPYSAVGWRLGKANSLAKVGGMTKAEISLACGLDAEKGVIGGRCGGGEEEDRGKVITCHGHM